VLMAELTTKDEADRRPPRVSAEWLTLPEQPLGPACFKDGECKPRGPVDEWCYPPMEEMD
jgi:hypothetical protein